MRVHHIKKLQSSAWSWKVVTLMRRTLIMSAHEMWVSSEALSGLAVSKSCPETVCVLITLQSRLSLLHLLHCAINIHMPEPTHCTGLIACLKMSPRCTRKTGEMERQRNTMGEVWVWVWVWNMWCHIARLCEIAFPCHLVKTWNVIPYLEIELQERGWMKERKKVRNGTCLPGLEGCSWHFSFFPIWTWWKVCGDSTKRKPGAWGSGNVTDYALRAGPGVNETSDEKCNLPSSIISVRQ